MRILFTRHGQSTANVLNVIANRGSDHPLTELGRRQAADLADRVRPARVARIVSSPLRRAAETAEIVGRALDVPVELSDALLEFDCGVFEGRSDDAAWAAHAAVRREWLELGHPEARLPDGESLSDMRSRFIPFVDMIAGDLLAGGASPAGTFARSALLISHGGLLRCLLPEVLDGVDAAAVRDNPLGNATIVAADVQPDGRLTCRPWPTSGS